MAHDHAPRDFGRAFKVGIGLNVAFVACEAAFGLLSGSTALVADAAHNLSDVLGLGIAWGATALAALPSSKQRTYGWRRSTVLAALANALFLLVAVGLVVKEALERLNAPPEVSGPTVIVVALVGVLINGVSAAMFARGRAADVNIRGAFLHLAADAAVSLGVALSGLALWLTGWQWLDPAASLLVSVAVLWGTWGLLRESLDLMLDAVPAGVNLAAIEAYLAALPGVHEVHDLHVWAMSTTENALTAHLVVTWNACPPSFLNTARAELHERFGIEHVTLQLEPDDLPEPCRLTSPKMP